MTSDQTDPDDSDAYNDDSIPPAYVYIPSNQTGPLPTVAIAYEVGTMTEVNISTTAHDTRPGSSSGDVGCGEADGDGCAAANTHDGIISDIESRWSCATMLVPDEGPCQIAFSFADPQDIVNIQVAFWEGNERTRTLDVSVDNIESRLQRHPKEQTEHSATRYWSVLDSSLPMLWPLNFTTRVVISTKLSPCLAMNWRQYATRR